MSQFLQNAREIFETAENGQDSTADYTILLGSTQGGIHLIANSDWSLNALQQAHGASAAYRVSHLNGRIVVDGSDGVRQCHLETVSPQKTAQFLLNATPAWHAAPSQHLLA